MRKLNFIFLIVLVAMLAVLGTGVHFLHAFQVRWHVSAFLGRADIAEAANDLAKAEQSLSHYLTLRRDDGEAWKRYAGIVERRDPDHLNRERVFLVYEEALRHNSGDRTFERKCADLAIEFERFNDAQRHLNDLLEHASKENNGQSGAGKVAELLDLIGQCDRRLANFAKAESNFKESLKRDPGRISTYDQLARLQRTDLHQLEEADSTIQKMVESNPNSGLAYIKRWGYLKDFSPPAPDSDIQKALDLAPDDSLVRLIAAYASEQKQDFAQARTHLKKGFQLDPKNSNIAIRLASLESRDGHLDQAESVLRTADKASPSLELAFILADTLVAQGKIEGDGQAGTYMTRLRNAGHGDTYVRFLESKILVKQKKWAEAIRPLQTARAILKADSPDLAAELSLMLAECYTHIGVAEQRLDALRMAGDGATAPESARVAFADELARSGKVDQAISILSPLSEGNPELLPRLVRLLLSRLSRQPAEQRNWAEVKRRFQDAQKALTQPAHVEELTLLHGDLLVAEGGLDEASTLLSVAQARDPKNLHYRLALARLSQRKGKGSPALQMIDQAEKDLGPSPEIQLARLDYWGREGGAAAKAAVAKLAENRSRIPSAELPTFLSRLATVEIQLREPSLARQHLHELANLQPDDIGARRTLFALALDAADHDDAARIVQEFRKIEGDDGTFWRFAQATLLIDKARRSASPDLEEARALAVELSDRQPDWWFVPTLKGEIAEIDGSADDAIKFYIDAVKLGNDQPSFVRRLVGLLSERNRTDEIDHVTRILRDRGVPLDDITIAKALAAIRKEDFDGGIALAQGVFPESSKSYSDHLMFGRLCMAAGRTDLAGKAFRRAVELGPGVPACWLDYVGYLLQTKQPDQARAVVEAAGKTLRDDRRTLTLAACFRLLGDLRQAEALITKALEDKDTSGDPATLRLAIMISMSQNRPDKVEKFLNDLDQVRDLSPGDKAWANRTHVAVLLSKNNAPDRNSALELVDQNLIRDPNSIDDKVLRATILALLPSGRAEAVSILERLDGAKQLDDSGRFLLARLYLDERNEERYRAEMEKLLSKKVKDPQRLSHFISYWTGRNQLDKAEGLLGELKKTEPDGLAALEAEARILDVRKKKPELLALLQSHLHFPEQIGIVADLLFRYGFLKEAEAAYKALIARDPSKPEGPLALAVCLAKEDRVSEAMEILTKAWSTFPSDRVAAASLALYNAPSVSESQRRQVENWCTEATRKTPAAVGLTVKVGSILIHQGRYDEAEALLRGVISKAPDHVEALNNLAWLLGVGDVSKTTEALELINHAIDLAGPISTLRDTRGVICIRAGQLPRAVVELTEARDRDPSNSSLARHLAWALQGQGKTEEARKAFQQAEKLGWKPQHTDPRDRAFMGTLQQELGL